MPLQGQQAGVQSVGGQPFAQAHDGDGHLVGDGVGVAGGVA
jgi:hypothetical protein